MLRPKLLAWRKPQAGATGEAECRSSPHDHPSVHERESEQTFVLRTLDWVEGRLAGRSRVLRGGVRSLLLLGGVLALCAGVLMLVLPGPGLLTMLVGVGLMGTVYRPAGLFAEAVAQKARAGWWRLKEWWRSKLSRSRSLNG